MPTPALVVNQTPITTSPRRITSGKQIVSSCLFSNTKYKADLFPNLPFPDANGDDVVLALTPGPSRESANFASPHSITSGTSMETVDPVKSLILRRNSGSAIYTSGPTKPLGDPLIARLLHHYINNLACWVSTNA